MDVLEQPPLGGARGALSRGAAAEIASLMIDEYDAHRAMWTRGARGCVWMRRLFTSSMANLEPALCPENRRLRPPILYLQFRTKSVQASRRRPHRCFSRARSLGPGRPAAPITPLAAIRVVAHGASLGPVYPAPFTARGRWRARRVEIRPASQGHVHPHNAIIAATLTTTTKQTKLTATDYSARTADRAPSSAPPPAQPPHPPAASCARRASPSIIASPWTRRSSCAS